MELKIGDIITVRVPCGTASFRWVDAIVVGEFYQPMESPRLINVLIETGDKETIKIQVSEYQIGGKI